MTVPAGGDAPVLLAVAHGTAARDGIAVLVQLTDRVRALAPGLRVELAYVDHEPPPVRRALAGLAASGAAVVVVPLLLTAAVHSKTDIPGAVRLVRAEHPGAALRYARPLGPDPALLRVLAGRLTEAGATGDHAVVVAAVGSADPDANAEVCRVARLLWEYRGGGPPVEAAFAGATSPSVADAVDRLRRLGHADVAVAPYVLAPGRLPRAVMADARAAGALAAGVLGAHDEVARLVLARYAEAAGGGPVAMNCDTCLYRAPWPGREDRVGTVQLPHPHPADG